MRVAKGIRGGKSVSPGFDVAVNRHQLLDVIQKASDTGTRQRYSASMSAAHRKKTHHLQGETHA
jgi:hypothetical protein